MATINSNNNVKPNDLNKLVPIRFICPVCKSQAELKISESIFNQETQLTTISIPKYKICEHHFQAFVDKNFKVRGYQKVDFEFQSNIIEKQKTALRNFEKDDEKLLENLIMEGNRLKYTPKKLQNFDEFNLENKEISSEKKNYRQEKKHEVIEKINEILPPEKKEMTLQEIYDEFWEFIDDNNEKFREFILNDSRRFRL